MGCFKNSGIEEIVLPSTLRKIDYRALIDCDCLQTVYVECGCRAGVLTNVNDSVNVQYVLNTRE